MSDPTNTAMVVLIVVGTMAFALVQRERIKSMSPEERADYESEHGPLNKAMVCPHCQTKGFVRARRIKQKVGVSGGKATVALLTGGASLLVAGLSRKKEVTQAFCQNCNSTWVF